MNLNVIFYNFFPRVFIVRTTLSKENIYKERFFTAVGSGPTTSPVVVRKKN